MFLIGMVHRDVSGGNILMKTVEDSITGKLSDLEYAKEEESSWLYPGWADSKTASHLAI